MNFMELIPIIGITAGSILTGFVIAKIVGLIKYWIDRRHDNSDDIELLLHQFNNYKKSVEKRLQHLETIVTEDPDERQQNPLLDSELNQMSDANDEKTEQSRLQNMLKKTH